MANAANGHRQRLKERFLTGTAQGRTDEALLELLLTYAIPQRDVQPLARRLLATFGHLPAVLTADLPALRSIDGIGEHAATLFHLTACIGERQFSQAPTESLIVARVHDDALQANAGVQPRDTAPSASGPEEAPVKKTFWRAGGPYTASNASKTGLVEETRLALLAYARLRDVAAVRQELLDGGLPQRSRATREIIARVIQERLLNWRPPAWVCDDLAASAEAPEAPDFRLLLLLHAVRQDALLSDVVHEVVWPRWREGLSAIGRVDVQRFLDGASPAHREIDGWSVATREKLAGNLLTILRDYGLLQGSMTKRIVEPVVSTRAAGHLARLLAEEGVDTAAMHHHDDWRIWLLDATRAQALVTTTNVAGVR